MKLFNFFQNLMQRKSNNGNTFNDLLRKYVKGGVETLVSPHLAYRAYNFNSALSDSVDMISERFSDIKPVIKQKDGTILTEHKILDFLKSPNKLQTYEEFALAAAINYLLNNNIFLEVIGFIKSKPNEIYNVRNADVSISEGNSSALYNITSVNLFQFLSGVFNLEMETGRILESSKLKELYHMKGFTLSTSAILAVSKISSIMRDVETVDAATTRNASLLKNGVSANGIISIDTEDRNSFEQFVKDLKLNKSGPTASGSLIPTMGKSVDFKSMELSNRDLEALRTKKDSSETVYSRFDIPKALVDSSSAKFNNLQVAEFALYSNAVLPLAKKIYSQLTAIFVDRNMLNNGEIISFDMSSIPALQLRRNEELKVLNDIGILSINELRSLAGYESISEGGDDVLVPLNKVPVGHDTFTDDNRTQPSKKSIDIMKKNGISETEINETWNRYKSIIR